MSRKPTAPGYANLDTFQAGLEKNDDVELAFINGINNFTVCAKCHSEKLEMPDGSLMCPHCNALVGRCNSCKKRRPVFQKICVQCRTDAEDAVERVKKWGERRGKALNFVKRHCGDFGKCIAVFALVAMAVCMFIPLMYEVNHLVKMGEKMADDVEGGIEPLLTEGGKIIGYAGRNAVGALRLLETPLNITGFVLNDVGSLVKKISEAVASPTAAFMAYNRVTGTTIICDDGTEHLWQPMVVKNGIVSNPYSDCLLHQTKLNEEDKAKFFPGYPAPKKGDAIADEHIIRPSPGMFQGPAYKDQDGGSLPNNGISLNPVRESNRSRTETNRTGK